MGIAWTPELGLRFERSETSRLAWAFSLSLLAHLLVFGTYHTGKQLGWWQNWRWPAWVQSVKLLSEILKKNDPDKPPPPPQEPPLMFVEVSPTVSTPEPPKPTPYYSDKNSLAANPDADKESDVPKISGQQKEVVRTEDVPRTKAFPLQPTPPPATPAKEEQPEAKPKPPPPPGDLALAKPPPPEPEPPKEEGEAPRKRPTTIKEALARNNQLAGQKMQQEGGVKRRNIESSLDVRGSPFGAYDEAIIRAVQNRWFDLLDNRNFVRDRTGKVTVRFHLNSDGSISELAFVQNTVDLALGLLCQSAIKDPAPFAPWPGDMKRLIGADFREVTFTFYYN